MSKTYIINFRTGEKITRLREKSKLKKTKFMGFTSGQHSHGVYDHVIEDDKFINILTDRAPIKNVDFVKYGYPMFGTQHKTILRDKAITKELNKELKLLLNKH